MKIIRPTVVSGQAITSLEDRRYPYASAGRFIEISMCNPDWHTIQKQLNERPQVKPAESVPLNSVKNEAKVSAEQYRVTSTRFPSKERR